MIGEVYLLAIYGVILIYQILLLVKAISKKEKERFVLLAIFEAACCFLAIVLSKYFDMLPGSGFMPGFTYFGEIIGSYVACAIYLLMFLITLISGIASRRKANK